MTYVEPSVQKRLIYSSGVSSVVESKNAEVKAFNEPPIVSKHKPIVINIGKNASNSAASIHRFSLRTTYNNNTNFFTNKEINKSHGINTIDVRNTHYDRLTKLYLNGALDDSSSPVSEFELLKYKQTFKY